MSSAPSVKSVTQFNERAGTRSALVHEDMQACPPGRWRLGRCASKYGWCRRNRTFPGAPPTGRFVPSLGIHVSRDNGERKTGSDAPARAAECRFCRRGLQQSFKRTNAPRSSLLRDHVLSWHARSKSLQAPCCRLNQREDQRASAVTS